MGELCRRSGVTEHFFYKDFANIGAVVKEVADEIATEHRRQNPDPT